MRSQSQVGISFSLALAFIRRQQWLRHHQCCSEFRVVEEVFGDIGWRRRAGAVGTLLLLLRVWVVGSGGARVNAVLSELAVGVVLDLARVGCLA